MLMQLMISSMVLDPYRYLTKYTLFDSRKLHPQNNLKLDAGFPFMSMQLQGGGRSSARETIGRVAAGAIAKKILKKFAGTEVSFIPAYSPLRPIFFTQMFFRGVSGFAAHPLPPVSYTHLTLPTNREV